MDNSTVSVKELLVKYNELAERQNEVEQVLETTNFNIYHLKVQRKCLEEILELSVIKHFSISRSDFHEKVYANIGSPQDKDVYEKRVIYARQWFMSIMVNMLHRTSYKMKWNYSFFDQKKVERHRSAYLSGVDGSDRENKIIFSGICSIAREMMNEEGLLDEYFDI